MKIVHICFTLCFFCIVLLPISLTLSNNTPKRIFLNENRTLAPKPKLKHLSLKDWPNSLDSWFQDQLAFRSHFTALYLSLWEDILFSPVKNAITGYHGEQFPILPAAPVLQNYLGLNPISKEQLIYFTLSHVGMHAFLQSQGIDYYLVTIPDKTTLYPEWLPFWVHWNKRESHYDQRVTILKTMDISWIDLLPPMQAKKFEYRMYSKKFDTGHWNGYGAEIASQVIHERLSQKEPTFAVEVSEPYYTIIWPKMNCSTGMMQEEIPIIQFLYATSLQPCVIPNITKEYPESWFDPEFVINTYPLSPTTICFSGDSYFFQSAQAPSPITKATIPLLARYSKQFLKVHLQDLTIPFLQQLIGTPYQPNIVVEAFSERYSGTYSRAYEDPKLRIYADLFLQTPGHILTPSTINGVLQNTNCILTHKKSEHFEDIVQLDASLEQPFIDLPSITTDSDGRAMFITCLVAPEKTSGYLYYKSKDCSSFTLDKAVRVSLEPGTNLVHLFILTDMYTDVDLRFSMDQQHAAYYIVQLPEDIRQFSKSLSDTNT